MALHVCLQKVICGKNETSLVHVRLLSGVGSGSSAICKHKNVHTMHFLFVFKLLFEKMEGEFLATTICPLATKDLYLTASWRSHKKVNFGPCLNVNFLIGHPLNSLPYNRFSSCLASRLFVICYNFIFTKKTFKNMTLASEDS